MPKRGRKRTQRGGGMRRFGKRKYFANKKRVFEAVVSLGEEFSFFGRVIVPCWENGQMYGIVKKKGGRK